MYNHAWVTSSNGDLNFDGDIYDATSYHYDYKFTSSSAYLSTDAQPGGTFEMWPSTHSTTQDEGHFYMECSNRGLCDRKTGLCKCFEGYEGGACKRRVCPNDCSGHGVCRSVSQLLNDYNTLNGASRAYNLWDKDMARTCKCDPGFTGPDCSEKLCPYGDDPLTTNYQINEVQWVEVRSELATGSVTAALGGTTTFSYRDHYGEVWTTDPISVMHYDATTTADQMATDLENALEGLPNDVFKDVSVTAGFCETVLPNKFAQFDANSATDKYNAGTNPTGFLRCPASSATYSQGHLVVDASDQTVYINGYEGSIATYEGTAVGSSVEAGGTDATCNLIVHPECVRFRIEFLSNPGDLEQITADISEVTINGKTNHQNGNTDIKTSTTDQLQLVTDSTASFGYTLTSGVVLSSTDDQGTINTVTKTISFGTASSNAHTFPVGVKIDLYCTTNSVKAYLGRYTVATTSTGGSSVTVTETIIAPNGDCATAGDGTTEINLVTHYIDTNIDFSNEALVGYAVNFDTFMGSSLYTDTIVESTSYPAAGTGYIFLEGTSSIGQTVNAATGVKLIAYGVGSKENVECGDRGLCDREAGDCKCFTGYTGDSCSLQNSLAA